MHPPQEALFLAFLITIKLLELQPTIEAIDQRSPVLVLRCGLHFILSFLMTLLNIYVLFFNFYNSIVIINRERDSNTDSPYKGNQIISLSDKYDFVEIDYNQ